MEQEKDNTKIPRSKTYSNSLGSTSSITLFFYKFNI